MKRLTRATVLGACVHAMPISQQSNAQAPFISEGGQAAIGAVLLMQYRPFYDEAAIEPLRGFEAQVYRHLE